MRNKSGGDTVLEADLGGLGGGYRGKISMSCQEEIPVDQEAGAG